MLWYDRLYVGEKAKKHWYSIIQTIRRRKGRLGVFVIMPASNGNNILDIYPTITLFHLNFDQRERMILGIAEGYQEALSLAGEIVRDMYQKTGAFCLEEFLEQSGSKV